MNIVSPIMSNIANSTKVTITEYHDTSPGTTPMTDTCSVSPGENTRALDSDITCTSPYRSHMADYGDHMFVPILFFIQFASPES